MDNFENWVHIFDVNLPYEGNLRWQGVQWTEVDIGRAISQDKRLVRGRGLLLLGGLGRSFEIRVIIILVGDFLCFATYFVQLDTHVSSCITRE